LNDIPKCVIFQPHVSLQRIMSSVLDRTLGILELLSQHGEGLELAVIAQSLNMPKSAAHRLLVDLIRTGYVRQPREMGEYHLTSKLISLGLTYLSKTGVVDIAQPLIDRLAEQTGELVRLSVVDGDRLTWVARAQGARQGLRYDPDMGSIARLSCSSSGWAWLASLPDDAALAMVAKQGLGAIKDYGPNAPADLKAVLQALQETRDRGYSISEETYTAGLNAMAAVVRLQGQPALGTLSVAGPSARLTRERMLELGPLLMTCAAQLASASGGSPMLARMNEARPIYAE
jgi:DNA-binding IclR family transcriptional regulator